MADRESMIARKQEVRRKIEAIQRQLEHERAKATPARRHIGQLERTLEQLQAEEYNLRVAIDQAHR
ncbi:MAG: hypothetical protein R3C14_15160 [Caldilineaceae bacterium]